MSKRNVTITINDEDETCNFQIEAEGMQRFEIIGILEVAKETIIQQLKVTNQNKL